MAGPEGGRSSQGSRAGSCHPCARARMGAAQRWYCLAQPTLHSAPTSYDLHLPTRYLLTCFACLKLLCPGRTSRMHVI